MGTCPACGGAVVRLPSSRLDQIIGWLTELRPHACSDCLWVGRQRPSPEQRRIHHNGPVTLPGGVPAPYRRRREPLSCCPICSQRNVTRATMRWYDRAIAIMTGRVPLACGYCFWTGRRRPHRSIRPLDETAVGMRAATSGDVG